MNKYTTNDASTNWDVYIKECLEVAATSATPYKIIPYKNGKGIKQAIVEKQNSFKDALYKQIKQKGFNTDKIEIITIG
jgi:hypothetical protein